MSPPSWSGCNIPATGDFRADLTTPAGLRASRVLHRLRVLSIPGIDRRSGPMAGGDPVLDETWQLTDSDFRLPALIEAGSYGATLATAAGAAVGDRFAEAGADARVLAAVLFDAALCGLDELSDRVVADVARLIGAASDLADVGALLASALGLWRHDRLLGAAGNVALAGVVDAATTRALWLLEGVRGGPAPADEGRMAAVVAVRDAVIHAEAVLSVARRPVVEVFLRAAAPDRPPDLQGAGVGMVWALDEEGAARTASAERAVRRAGRPDVLGDFLAGLFAVAREQVLDAEPPGITGLLDELLGRFSDDDFLVALPSLRLAFSWFPPRERAAIAHRLLDVRGLQGSGSSLLRLQADPVLVARARALEARVDDLLSREALVGRR